MNNTGNSSVPPGVSSVNQHMNSLKSMAENAILNLTPQQQQTSLNSQLSSLNSGFLNNSNELPIANLLAATVGGLNDPNDPNTAAAFATLIGTLS